MRVGIDVHVVGGAEQGTVSLWRSLLHDLPPHHEYVLYSFAPALTRRLWPEPRFRHRQIPIRQAHVRIQLVYPLLGRRDRCDVFHVNFYGPLIGAPGLVVSVHDVIYLDFPEFAPPGSRLRMRILGKLSARAARRITTGSEYSRRRVAHHFGVPEERIRVVPDGLGREWHQPNRQRLDEAWGRVRQRLPARYVLTVGRWDPRKNFPLCARVVRELVRRDLTDALVIVGPRDFGFAAIREEMDRDGAGAGVVWLQDLSREELQAVYRGAQCLLYMSLAEGFGMPLIESMAMRTPVIVSNRTSMPEVCASAGIIVDPDDERVVVEAVQSVLSDQSVHDRLARAGIERVRRFTGAEMARAMAEVYEEAAASGAAWRI